MCGILGSINLPFEDRVLDLIAHRGPDDSGRVTLECGKHLVNLAHRRLAIVDLSPTGHQPMRTPSGHWSLIFNGEIYNHQSLRTAMPDVSFRGHSDTETILQALARDGIDAVRQFNGIFSLAFVDSRAGKLFLARDPFGVKPLYYWHVGNRLLFSSEIRPIQALVQDSLSPDHLAEVLRLRFSPSPATMFQHIRKVRPGHFIEIDLHNSGLRLKEVPYAAPPALGAPLGEFEAKSRYGKLFTAAVQRQLMSDVEVGVLLSGGVDSALVAAVAQANSARPMKAFTVGYATQDESDEIAEAAETAAVLGLEHHVARFGFDDYLSTLAKCVEIVEEPLATTSTVPMFHLATLASQHVKVVLSGQGADEFLGGYGRYQGEICAPYVPSLAARSLLPLATALGVKNSQALRALQSWHYPDDQQRFLATYEVFTTAEIKRLTGHVETNSSDRVRYLYEMLNCGQLPTSVMRMMALDTRLNLSDDLLLYTDKITMHHSIECRVSNARC